jgi:K+-transporting ATPase KdpF subunit
VADVYASSRCSTLCIAPWGFYFWAFAGPSPRRVIACRLTKDKLTMEYLLAGVIALGLFIYLIYALLRPEKF